MSTCGKCGDEHYILLGCCDGRECGCGGQPVQMTNCSECNPDGDKPMGDYTDSYANYVEYVGVVKNKVDNETVSK